MDPHDVHRPRGIFTKDDREYLLGRKEYEHAQTESNVKSRIRERTFHALLDAEFLGYIPYDQREQIFRMWEIDVPDVVEDAETLGETDLFERKETERQYEAQRQEFIDLIVQLLIVIYHDLKRADVADPQPVFERAIEGAEYIRGAPGKATIQFSEGFNTEYLLGRFERGERLSSTEIQHLRETKDLGGQDLVDYYDRVEERQQELRD